MTRSVVRYSALSGLLISVAFALSRGLTLAEFIWTFWLVGMCSSYLAIVRLGLYIPRNRTRIVSQIPFLASLGEPRLLEIALVGAAAACFALWYVFTLMFAFYGVFISVWVNLEPMSLFGRNEFINSDFWSPLIHLTKQYWPLIVGQLIAEVPLLFQNPGAEGPLRSTSRELRKLHVIVLLLPFVAVGSWMLTGARYETLSVLVLIVIKGLLDVRKPNAEALKATQDSAEAQIEAG